MRKLSFALSVLTQLEGTGCASKALVANDTPVDGGIAFVGATVFDGESTRCAVTVVVEGELIVEVAVDAADKFAIDAATVVDATGLTMLPGLIDAHTHTYEVSQLAQAARFGVTTELDMLASPSAIANLKVHIANRFDLADLRSAGNPVLATGGFGTQWGVEFETLDNPDDAEGFVARRLAEGSDYIKILQDDGRLWGLDWPTVDGVTVAAAIHQAHEQGLAAYVHAPRPADALHALESGADGMLSIYAGRTQPAIASELIGRQSFLVPTMSFMLDLCGEPIGAALAADPDIASRIDAETKAALESSLGTSVQSCAEFRSALSDLVGRGALVVAGTDAPQKGVVHGVSLHAELELQVVAGMTLTQALQSATSRTADAFGLTDRGRIAVGKRADLLLVDGDPTQDITRTRAIRAVYLRGQKL